jgi:hypothetical protein
VIKVFYLGGGIFNPGFLIAYGVYFPYVFSKCVYSQFLQGEAAPKCNVKYIHYERQKLEKVVKVSLIRSRVEKVGILLYLFLENDWLCQPYFYSVLFSLAMWNWNWNKGVSKIATISNSWKWRFRGFRPFTMLSDFRHLLAGIIIFTTFSYQLRISETLNYSFPSFAVHTHSDNIYTKFLFQLMICIALPVSPLWLKTNQYNTSRLAPFCFMYTTNIHECIVQPMTSRDRLQTSAPWGSIRVIKEVLN